MFDTTPQLDCKGRALVLDRPRLMGIVNVTPDSFSDGGVYLDPQRAIEHGLRLVEEGADVLDIGGESTRPGAEAITGEEEIARVVPVIQALAAKVSVPISVDTSKAAVMRAAVAAGAGLINDVRALREEGALDAAAELRVPVCLMHMQGEPRTMQASPQYDDVVGEVKRFLADRILACEFAGVDKKRLLVDPGFGFGKKLEHNLGLLRAIKDFTGLGVPLLVGLSRKGMIGALTGRDSAADRVHGSVAAALLAAQGGAAVLRVHDVAATRDALTVWQAAKPASNPKERGPFGSMRFGDDD